MPVPACSCWGESGVADQCQASEPGPPSRNPLQQLTIYALDGCINSLHRVVGLCSKNAQLEARFRAEPQVELLLERRRRTYANGRLRVGRDRQVDAASLGEGPKGAREKPLGV